MSRVLRPDDVWTRLNNLQRQINDLGRVSQLANASITKGSLVVIDADGNVRVRLGQLPTNDYGLEVIAPTGQSGEVFPPKIAFHAGNIQTTSTAYSVGAGSPSLTVTLGASGDAIVIASANIGIDSSNDTGTVGISIDGGTPYSTIWASGGTSTLATSSSLAFTASELNGVPLTPGRHNFTMQQKGSTAGHTFNFSRNALVVWPI